MVVPDSSDDAFLQGAFEPIRMECDCEDLAIEGRLPDDLKGTLYRIGPNPQFAPRRPYNPLQGDGMIHAFRIAEGRVSYRNRWVRTQGWRLERDAGRALFATSDPRDNDPSVAGVDREGAANTHIVCHANRLLALEEGHAPIAIARETLATLGRFDFAGRLPGNMSAHPKIDPATGELLFFANFPDRRFDGALNFFTADAGGSLVCSERIEGPYPALVHDFAISESYVIFIVCPVTLSLARLRAGGPPIAWEGERETFVGVMPRTGSGADVRWFPAPTCMVWHTLNAYEDGGNIQIDLCEQAAPAFRSADGAQPPEASLRQYLSRWTVDLASNQPVKVRRLSDVVCEYPRIDERCTGRPYRYGFVAAVGGPGTGDLSHRAIGRFDHHTEEMQLWMAPKRQAVSEPVFVPRPGTKNEGDGYLLATIFDEELNRSHLAILDARDIERGPVAVAQLDHRVPAGFHGSFVADSEAGAVTRPHPG